MNNLQGKVAVVTGGSQGIGKATAAEFIARGARVVITGRSQEKLDAAVTEIGGDLVGIQSDASVLSDTERLVERVRERYGMVDVLFVNAGVALQEPVGDITETTFDQMINLNLKGAIFTTERFLPILRDGASIVNMTSVSAFSVMSTTAIYSATKAALTAYSKTAALSLASRGIRVNTVAPALTETEAILEFVFPDPALRDQLAAKFPMKRMGKPEEVAKLVAFLASDDASFISGAEYVIDGAVTLSPPF